MQKVGHFKTTYNNLCEGYRDETATDPVKVRAARSLFAPATAQTGLKVVKPGWGLQVSPLKLPSAGWLCNSPIDPRSRASLSYETTTNASYSYDMKDELDKLIESQKTKEIKLVWGLFWTLGEAVPTRVLCPVRVCSPMCLSHSSGHGTEILLTTKISGPSRMTNTVEPNTAHFDSVGASQRQ